MATQYYAYSTIRHDNGVVKPGDKVDQKTIGVSDEEWESLVHDNAVVDKPIPDDLSDTDSLTNYYLRKAQAEFAAAQAGVVQTEAGAEAAAEAATLTKNE